MADPQEQGVMVRRSIRCGCGSFPEGKHGHRCMECGQTYRAEPTLPYVMLGMFSGRWAWFMFGWLVNCAVWLIAVGVG